MSLAIRVENLGKRYAINRDAPASTSLREQLGRRVRRILGARLEAPLPDTAARAQEYWALKDVSFDIAEGDRVGIIGANGAGKSTLLKLLSRVTSPSEGRIEIHGKVASLLEVGTGFHPDLTGRENVFLSGAILGMSRKEIQAKFDQIVEFSGVERFIDTPVKHYSSGMYVRLAFSVSAWLDPDILIVDEVLAVGDQEFQKKCTGRMKDLAKEGRTVLFVSHSMTTISQMCRQVLYLENGRVVFFGPVDEGARDYNRDVIEKIETEEHRRYEKEHGPIVPSTDASSATKERAWQWHRASFQAGDPVIEIIDCRPDEIRCIGGAVIGADGRPRDVLRIDEPFRLRLDYEVLQSSAHRLVPNFHLYTEAGERVFVAYPEMTATGVAGRYSCDCLFEPFTLNVGRFQAGLALSSFELEQPVHIDARNALRFEIVEEPESDPRRHGWLGDIPGLTRPRLQWEMDSGP